MSNYEKMKINFINEYANYKKDDNITNIIQSIIPYFELFACDLDELINEINIKYKIDIESLDYIESIFNPILYQIIFSQITNHNDNCFHYLIILIEFSKYENYLKIKDKLKLICENNKIESSIFYDGLNKATDEKLEDCINKITSTYTDLMTNFKHFKLSQIACEQLLLTNKITENILNYKSFESTG